MHEVIVENVGTVYRSPDHIVASDKYDQYAGVYRPFGCAWFADVTWIEDDEVIAEYYDPDRERGEY